MKTSAIAKTVCAVSLSAVCALGLASCSQGSATASGVKLTGGVAATVNGAEIPEDDVTISVETVRAQLGVTDEDSWGEWLSTNSYTPEKVREEVIDSLTTRELIKQGAEERGVTVDDSEVQSYVDSMKSRYSSDEQWQQALTSANTTEDQYKENIRVSLLQQRLQETFAPENVSDEDVVEYAKNYMSTYDGAKRSSHILFKSDDEATAQEVLDKINSGELDFAEAAKEYSQDTGSAENGGDVGWDKLTSFVSEYTTALDALEKDQVSGLVTSSYGIHIIKCTDVFTAPEELTSLDQLPSDIADTLKSRYTQSQQSTAYQQWLSEAKDSADVQINDMPDGLPYYVDMSKYEASDSSDSSSDASTDSADGTSSDDSSTEDSSSDAATTDESASSDGSDAAAEAA